MNFNERNYPPAPILTSSQRAHLRSLAANLSPITQIGKGGITENLAMTVCDALEARELIKLHVLENSGEAPRDVLNALTEALGAEGVAVTGRKIVLYRASSKKPVIELPRA